MAKDVTEADTTGSTDLRKILISVSSPYVAGTDSILGGEVQDNLIRLERSLYSVARTSNGTSRENCRWDQLLRIVLFRRTRGNNRVPHSSQWRVVPYANALSVRHNAKVSPHPSQINLDGLILPFRILIG